MDDITVIMDRIANSRMTADDKKTIAFGIIVGTLIIPAGGAFAGCFLGVFFLAVGAASGGLNAVDLWAWFRTWAEIGAIALPVLCLLSAWRQAG